MIIAVMLLFIVSFILPQLWLLPRVVLALAVLALLVDIAFLFVKKHAIQACRVAPDRLSNGDENEISIQVANAYNSTVILQIIDEVPFQFQKRDFEIHLKLLPHSSKVLKYHLTPKKRGVYLFGKLNVYAQTRLGLIQKRFVFDAGKEVATYPSFLQMQKFELLAASQHLSFSGLKKIKRLGHSSEFDQIKEYVIGDDVRHLNWKATARKNQLMVNQYQDERAQPVYAIIDKGRVMKMPFEGMSLVDYAINATLSLCNVILKKHDRAGMLAFSNTVENLLVAEKRNAQMQLLMENLYRLDTDFAETDFGRLYSFVKAQITHRSLLMVFTNFETMDALNRQLKYLRALAKLHVVVVVFFKNTELEDLIAKKSKNIHDIYDKAIAEKMEFEKKIITNELRKYGIYTVLTRPENLTGDTINKYLELKARGLV